MEMSLDETDERLERLYSSCAKRRSFRNLFGSGYLRIRVIQLAVFDVYYEIPTEESRKEFLSGLSPAVVLKCLEYVNNLRLFQN